VTEPPIDVADAPLPAGPFQLYVVVTELQPGVSSTSDGQMGTADQTSDPIFDRRAYREHNVVEELINRLKQWRRIAIRHEKCAVNYLAMLNLAAKLLWL
jgi:transposase